MNGRHLPVDPLLPQLPLALDGAAMAGVLDDLIGAHGPRLLDCEVERCKYRPRRNLSVGYRLHLQGGAEQRVSARFCTGGDSARRHARHLDGPVLPTTAGPVRSHVPALDLFLHWWPNDPRLRAARLLAGPDALAALLPADRGAPGVTVVQWVPEHRLTIRVDRHAAPVYAKADAEDRGATTQRSLQALWDSAARREGRLRLPRPLGWQAGPGLQWLSALPGRALLDLAPRVAPPQAAAVGQLLAALHATPAPLARDHDAASLLQRLHAVADTLRTVEPAWAATLARLTRLLAEGLARHGQAPAVTLHGDLHPRNVLWHEGRCALIDFDSLTQGPAWLDLGAWLADDLYRAVLADQPPAPGDAAACAFVDAYAAAGGRTGGAAALAWATAWQLVCQRAWRGAVNLKPGRFARVPALLDLAEQLARQGLQAPGSNGHG